GQASDTPEQSLLPMYAIAMRPFAPAVTSGKTVLPSDDGLTWICGVQYEPGRPPCRRSFRLSRIGEMLRKVVPPAVQTPYALPPSSSAIHGKISGLSEDTTVACHASGFWYSGPN